jgi:drug/metabolite transporter (DMT)-like permease
VMVVFVSLVSAFFFALASVLQHRGAAGAPDSECMRPSLLTRLARQPLWLGGIAADLAGFGAQFWALGHGPLALVQPLLVSGLLFALPLAALVAHRRIPARDMAGAGAVVIGLSLFLVVSHPGNGRPASSLAWVMAGLATMAPVAALSIVALPGGPMNRRRAPVLAAAAGIAYGLGAALVDATAHELAARGWLHALASWQPYALAAVGMVTLLLAQSAFQAGPLTESLPILTMVDPIVSVVIGALLLGEPIAHSGTDIALELLGIVMMCAGIMVDGRSVLVAAVDAVGGGSRAREAAGR